METKDLVRRRPGQNGCCGCMFGALLGLGTLALGGFWKLRPRRRGTS
jgi:hypothetical protein